MARNLGDDMYGLIEYLFGPGRRNEHDDPHLIAAHTAGTLPGAPRFRSGGDLAELAAELDGDRAWLPTPDERPAVWHCALSNPAGDRHLSDDEWAECVTELVRALAFTADGSRAACQWAAIHHGLSHHGNEHVHIVACLIREDGTRASNFRLWPKASKVAADLEKCFGLTIVDGRAHGGRPGLSGAELARAARTGQEPERRRLARLVRAAATIAADEAEFARRIYARAKVQPRVTEDGQVVGYSVALANPVGEKTIWYSGGKLATDLTLNRLRESWLDARGEALSAWMGDDIDAGREDFRLPREAWQQAVEQVDEVRRQLTFGGVRDQRAWMDAAAQTAGVLAALDQHDGTSAPGPFAVLTDLVADVAQPRQDEIRHHGPTYFEGLRFVALVVAQAILDIIGLNALVAAVLKLVGTLMQLRASRAAIRQASEAAASVRDRLQPPALAPDRAEAQELRLKDDKPHPPTPFQQTRPTRALGR